jgi:crotonobetainyl-CoA:carnitine CoA-transferase CaiB-like acyl-CoA transferase
MYALEGIRVLDLSRAVPGPYCTMLLGDMGADVLMIEEARPPSGRRATRAGQRPVEPPSLEDVVREAAQNPLRRNKRSLCLDLKHEEGRAIFYELAAHADVIIEGFRPGVARRLRVDYETVQTLNEAVVYCSLTGYGQTGPYSQLAGHDIDYVAMAGVLGAIGRPGSKPAIPLNLVGDMAGGGLMAAFAIALALFHRERTGRGQYIDHAMTDGALSMMARVAGQFLASGAAPVPGEERLTGALPHYDVYECKDGRFIAVGALEPWFYQNLCRALGHPELAEHGEDAPYDTREGIRATFRERFLERTRDEWFALLREADACAAPVYAIDEALSDPHQRHREMLLVVDHPTLGKAPQVGVVPKLVGSPGAVRTGGPRPGQHTDDVLREVGYGVGEIQQLREAGIVA